jgi:ABC-type antimicrobial peptide transport system permease subunit
VGLYGLLTHYVGSREVEIGIRAALGADRSRLLRHVVGQAMTLVALGLGLGVFTGFMATRLIASLLSGVSATDPLTFVAVVALLFAVALVAIVLPGLRAAKVDPLVVMRSA